MNQEDVFELTKCLALIQIEKEESRLIRAWGWFFENLWGAMENLEKYEWGRCVRRNVGFALTRLRDELRKIELEKAPRLMPGEIGYVCDSLKCELRALKEAEEEWRRKSDAGDVVEG